MMGDSSQIPNLHLINMFLYKLEICSSPLGAQSERSLNGAGGHE